MKNNDRRQPIPDKKYLLIGACVLTALLALIVFWAPTLKQPDPVSLTSVAKGVIAGNVVRIEDTLQSGALSVHYQDGSVETSIRDTSSSLLEQLNQLGVTADQLSNVEIEMVKDQSAIVSRGISTGLSVVLIGIMAYVAVRMLRNGPMNKKTFAEGEIPSVRFRDVAGIDENLQELRDIVTFLKQGDRYADIGAKMPHGILLVGAPGTGKTLMAKAIAGEAGVPFFAISGSEFVEVFVGVGASRVRSLFQKARKVSPCIIFIDEIDAVGRERHGSGGGAEMEQDQTLNQLLVEMDGFDTGEGVVVLAATNRVDVLDPALTRPGRFDRQVYINRPDVKGRQAILNIHVAGKKIGPDVDLANVAKATPGLAGADLANIVNEAAIVAVRNDHTEIWMTDFEEAVEKNIAGGVQRKNQVISDDEKRIIAFHEAGHAVAIHESHLADPVYKITIIPRGQTGGYTMSLPDQDRMLMSKNKFLAHITGLMGGRAAEEIFFQDVTSGASNDLQVATQLAEEMVMRLGMDTTTGLRVFSKPQGLAALSQPHSSQKTFETIDEAVRGILELCYSEAVRILNEKRAQVESLANELLEVETVSRDRFVELMHSPVMATEKLE
jgi:cell division protease FtsH